jgi:N-acetylneuraminic acid mutarotase
MELKNMRKMWSIRQVSIVVFVALLMNSFSCKDEENEPEFAGSIKLTFENVGAATADIVLDIQPGNSIVKLKQVFIVYGETSGLTEASGSRIDLLPEGGTTYVHGLKAETTYYAKAFIYDEDGKPHHTDEVSVNTKRPIINWTMPYGKRGSLISVTGYYFSREISENKIFFGDREGQVTAVLPGSYPDVDSLKVIVPNELADGPVAISIRVGGVSTVFANDFVAHNISITSVSSDQVFLRDTVRIYGTSLPEDGVIKLDDQEQITTYHHDPAGNYYSFPALSGSGVFKLSIDNGAVQVFAPKKLTVLPDQWIAKQDFRGHGNGASFIIGNKAYVALEIGNDQFNDPAFVKEFWEYNIETDSWTRKADLPGDARRNSVAFSVGGKGYVGTGIGSIAYNDFWEYDPINDVWTQKADFPGSARYAAVGLAIGDKGYIGLGDNSNSLLNDWWQYNPSADSWSRMTDFPGDAREFASAFAIGNRAYVGVGNTASAVLSDFWEFNPADNSWTRKADIDGGGRTRAVAFAIGTTGIVATGLRGISTFEHIYPGINDCWQYNVETDSWIQLQRYLGYGRFCASGFSNGSRGFVTGGIGAGATLMRDVWEFKP